VTKLLIGLNYHDKT